MSLTAALIALAPVASAQEQPPPPPTESPPPAAPPAETAPPAAEAPPAEAPAPAEAPPATPTDTGVEATAEEPVAAEEPIEEITVTGSTIRRKDLVTPAPVVILDKVDLDAAGAPSIGDVLQNLVSQGNAINVQFNNGGDGSTRVNLRGLGAVGPSRTLVLLNGRRHVYGGTGANSSVDLNSIPYAVIERVEVLKDGGSAIYGSDAIGGVVNIITRRGFNGVEGTAFTATSQRGDGTLIDLSVTGGAKGDKGNVLVSVGYYKQNTVWAGERDFAKVDHDFDYETGEVLDLGSGTTPQGRINISRTSTNPNICATCSGNQAWLDLVASQPETTTSLYKDPAGNPNSAAGWRRFNGAGTSDLGTGDLYNYQPANYLVTPSERYNVVSTGDYELKDDQLTVYYEASYTNRRSDQLLAAEPVSTATEGIVVSADNMYNPFGRNFSSMQRRIIETGGRNFLQDVDTFRVVTGVTLDLPTETPVLGGWNWDASFNFGRTASTNSKTGLFQRSKFAAAVGPSFMAADGTPTCGTPTAPIANCVPLNVFGGEGSISDDMLSGLTYTGVARGFNQMREIGLRGTGELFKLPFGGPVGLAVGVSQRNEAGGDQPDPLTAAGDTTGNKSQPVNGGYDVFEAFGELAMVLLEDKPAVDALEISGAVRGYNYSNFGGGATWKVGGRWSIIPDVAVRGTVSTAFRAPSISNLYGGRDDNFPSVTDPCDTSQEARTPTAQMHCQADGLPDNYTDDRTQILSRVGSNPDLDPETADVFTVGAVFVPRFLEGFSLTLDYYNIKIDNSIQPAGAAVLLNNCYQLEERDQAACAAIHRDADGFITEIIDLTTNIGGAEAAGLDITANYRLKAGSFGQFRFGIDATWLQKYDEIQANGRTIHGKGNYDLELVAPDLKLNFSTLWNMGGWGAGVNVRYISGFKECEDFACNVEEGAMPSPSRDVAANVTADLFASRSFVSPIGKTTLGVGVNNITDQAPSPIYTGFLASSDAATYDYIGRLFYIRLTQAY
jgi:outer membrane receptor protein involved in Fe transport